MSDFLQELKDNSLTPDKRTELTQQFEEWLTDAIDEWAKDEIENAKKELLQLAQSGKFRTEGEKRVIVRDRPIQSRSLAAPSSWKAAQSLINNANFPYIEILNPKSPFNPCFSLRAAMGSTIGNCWKGFFRPKFVKKEFKAPVLQITFKNWGRIFWDTLKKYANAENIQLSVYGVIEQSSSCTYLEGTYTCRGTHMDNNYSITFHNHRASFKEFTYSSPLPIYFYGIYRVEY